jgi:hypothetical protein
VGRRGSCPVRGGSLVEHWLFGSAGCLGLSVLLVLPGSPRAGRVQEDRRGMTGLVRAHCWVLRKRAVAAAACLGGRCCHYCHYFFGLRCFRCGPVVAGGGGVCFLGCGADLLSYRLVPVAGVGCCGLPLVFGCGCLVAGGLVAVCCL